MILCIDPSSTPSHIGWAIFSDHTLRSCGRQAPPSRLLANIAEAVIERPVIYPHGKTPNPNSIVLLAVTVGELAGVLTANGVSVRYVEPRAWKGTLDKDTCCRRAWSRLRPGNEQSVAALFRPESSGKVKGGKDHVLDAIGIGLWAGGRWRT